VKANIAGLVSAALIALAFSFLIAPILPIRLNETNSVPTGLYWIQKTPAPYAGFCLDEKTVETALQAGLQLSSGECPDGRETILKIIFKATPEQPISFAEDGFMVGKTKMANTAAKTVSRAGRPLQHAPYGQWTSGVFAISTYNRDSWDSRYFGPVPESSIRYYAKPFFLFSE